MRGHQSENLALMGTMRPLIKHFSSSTYRTYRRRMDRLSQRSAGTPSDTPPCVNHLHSHQLFLGPADGAFRRAHLVRTASGSNSSSHAIASGRPIVIGFETKLLCKPRYGALHITTKIPRDAPADCSHHRHRCLGMESTATRTSSTHDNLPAAETCATSTRHTLRISAPPRPSPYHERKPALQTGAIAHTIATK